MHDLESPGPAPSNGRNHLVLLSQMNQKQQNPGGYPKTAAKRKKIEKKQPSKP